MIEGKEGSAGLVREEDRCREEERKERDKGRQVEEGGRMGRRRKMWR